MLINDGRAIPRGAAFDAGGQGTVTGSCCPSGCRILGCGRTPAAAAAPGCQAA
jgi:hypothetical protein